MQNKQYGEWYFRVVKGVAAALVISLLAAVVFAGILKLSPLPQRVIYPINQSIKVAAVFIAVFVFVRGEKGYLQGIAIGVLFTMLSYLSFSAIGGDFSLSWLIFGELALAMLVGCVAGALAVNSKRD